jgi:tetratricopeptide (TPR) repeat protein
VDRLAEAALALAVRRREAGDAASAAEILRLVPSGCEGYADAQVELGDLSLQARDPEAARRAFLLAREADPRSFGARVGLAQIHELLREFEPAAALWKEAVALRADSAPAHYQLAFCLWRLGQAEAAMAACRKALDLEPRNARARRLMEEMTAPK